jgi:hypothetical protein
MKTETLRGNHRIYYYDVFEYGGNLWPAAKHVQRFAKHHADNTELQEAAAAFCSQWPDGPQIV